MHSYALYYPVDAECLCCHIVSEFYFYSEHDLVVCKGCHRHQGATVDKLRQRDEDHVAFWKSELGVKAEDFRQDRARAFALVRERDAKISELTDVVNALREQLKADLRNGPEEAVRAWFDGERIAAAKAEVDKSYRSRAHVLRVLWALDQLHHDDEKFEGRCSCGEETVQCSEWQAIYRARESLYRWEAKQVDRVRQGFDQELPRDHPEVVKHGAYWRTSAG